MHLPSRRPASDTPELSETKLKELSTLLHGPDPMGRRNALRIPVEGFVAMTPLAPGAPPERRRVGVYDLSRTGIALVDDEPIPAGSKFDLHFAREDGTEIELLCTARHARKQGEAWITGAEFGVSWLAALGASVLPPKSSGE
jgi:hypothetical protein